MSINRRNYEQLLESLQAKNMSLTTREMTCGASDVWVVYIKQLVDTQALSRFVIMPMLAHYTGSLTRPKAKKVVGGIIGAAECRVENDFSKVESLILDGMAVLLMSDDDEYVVANLKEVTHRAVETPGLTYSMLGPKDSFVENLDVNISLIRYRLKDPTLKIDMFELGKRTKTAFAVIYISDIANEGMVNEIENRVRNIDTDAVWGTGDMFDLLGDNKHQLFKQFKITERSDMACEALTEGKVVLLGEGGSIALLAPITFPESMSSCDDRYDNKFFGMFSRFIRYVAMMLTLTISSIYVALVAFRPDALPGTYVILLAKLRANVLFPAMLEVLLVEFILELVREALIRVPSKIGTAIGIVGAIIIGDAASAAGIFDALVLILISASLLASFALPDYISMHPIRILKFFMIIVTGLMGFYGFVLGLAMILTNLVSIESFGVPFMAPFAPYNRYDAKRAFIFSRQTSSLRMQYMNTQDDTRSTEGERIKKKLNKNK